jgi:hypothetical protein
VATSGSYNDLSNKPTIPAAQVNSDWNASSGVAQILNKPVIPTKSFYGTCATAKGTAAKVVTCSEFTSSDLVAGTRIAVLMTNESTYNGTSTLNINSTGAYNVYYVSSGTNDRYMWNAGEVVDFIFDGTRWITINGGLATTSYYGVTKLTNSVSSTSTSTAATPNSVKQAYDLANGKQDALTPGTNIQINGTTISATDTTYSAFTGTDGTAAGTAGLVPAPATTDADKFLKSDGTWSTAGSSAEVFTTNEWNALWA